MNMTAPTKDDTRGTPVSAARMQVHHALQFASGFGISYVPRRQDDSHTNLGWSDTHQALVSREAAGSAGTVAVGLRITDLTLLVLLGDQVSDRLPLHGVMLREATSWLRAALDAAGVEPTRYTLDRHFEIPVHAVMTGAPFDASDTASFATLAQWLALANHELHALAARRGGSDVRLWPHHADIATLFHVGATRSTGAGMAMGDGYYEEPYFYVNAYPAPEASTLPALAGGGHWHTHEWVGAVLPVSGIRRSATEPSVQVATFLDASVATTTRLLGA